MSQAFSGMDLELLVGEPVDPAELSDDIFANMLDRFWEANCKKILIVSKDWLKV